MNLLNLFKLHNVHEKCGVIAIQSAFKKENISLVRHRPVKIFGVGSGYRGEVKVAELCKDMLESG